MSASGESSLFRTDDVLDDRYRIVRLVGQGGTGEVYEAEDTAEGGRVALKTVLPEFVGSAKIALRFEREKEFSQRISHPGVLRIFDLFTAPLGTSSGTAPSRVPCMVMEYLNGETVADRLMRGEKFSPEEAKPVVCQVAAALTAAHRAGIVHRDLKPDNMFLVPAEDGTLGCGHPEAGPRVVLTDFGVARRAAPPKQEESLTASNVLLGTPTYMAPEQLELEKAMPASDIYTLGLVMFEMITGRPPFEGETAIKTVFLRLEQDPPSPREYVPDLDQCWEDAILRCLERNPDDRFADAQGIIRTLDGDDSPWLVPAGMKVRRLLLAAAAAVLVALVAVAGVILLT